MRYQDRLRFHGEVTLTLEQYTYKEPDCKPYVPRPLHPPMVHGGPKSPGPAVPSPSRVSRQPPPVFVSTSASTSRFGHALGSPSFLPGSPSFLPSSSLSPIAVWSWFILASPTFGSSAFGRSAFGAFAGQSVFYPRPTSVTTGVPTVAQQPPIATRPT